MPNRRQHIIDQASEVVYVKGFNSTTIDDVLAAASVGKGNFYHYFRSKDDLAVAIIDDFTKWVNSPQLDELFSHDKAPLQRLADFLDLVLRQRKENNHGDPLGNLASELGDLDRFSSRIRRAYDALVDRFEAVVAESAAESNVKVDAHSIARQLVGQLHGLSALYKVDRDEAAFQDGLVRIVRCLQSELRVQGAAHTERLKVTEPGRV